MIDLQNLIQTEPYAFLRKDPHLGSRILFLAFGGSYAHGIPLEYSDVDLRGCAVNSPQELLGMESFDHYRDSTTDTVIYSLFRFALRLLQADPDTVELLAEKPEQYAMVSRQGELLLANKQLFFTQRLSSAYTGYIHALLEYLQLLSSRVNTKAQVSQRLVLERCQSTLEKLNRQLQKAGQNEATLSLRTQEGREQEICLDLTLKGFPLRTFHRFLQSTKNIVDAEEQAAIHRRQAEPRLAGKKMATLVRLLLTCCELLETGQLHTCREDDAEMLIAICNGAYLGQNCTVHTSFYELLDPLLSRLEYGRKHTVLPSEPNMESVNALIMQIHREVLHEAQL